MTENNDALTIVSITIRPLIEINEDTGLKVIITYYVQYQLNKTDVKRTTHVFHSHNSGNIMPMLLGDIFDKLAEITGTYDKPDTIVQVQINPAKIHNLLKEALKNVES